jgi:hypothetical protein
MDAKWLEAYTGGPLVDFLLGPYENAADGHEDNMRALSNNRE